MFAIHILIQKFVNDLYCNKIWNYYYSIVLYNVIHFFVQNVLVFYLLMIDDFWWFHFFLHYDSVRVLFMFVWWTYIRCQNSNGTPSDSITLFFSWKDNISKRFCVGKAFSFDRKTGARALACVCVYVCVCVSA